MKLCAAFDFRKNMNEHGVFEGYASTFGNVDYYGETIAAGAFKKSLAAIKKSGSLVKMLWQHNPSNPIGVFETVQEDANGLYVKGALTLGVPQADQAYLLLKSGAVDAMSIGGRVGARDPKDSNIITEIDLREISLATFPANDKARVDTVKSIKCLESYLRDEGGFSAKEAKAIISKAKSFASQRDVVGIVKSTIDELRKLT